MAVFVSGDRGRGAGCFGDVSLVFLFWCSGGVSWILILCLHWIIHLGFACNFEMEIESRIEAEIELNREYYARKWDNCQKTVLGLNDFLNWSLSLLRSMCEKVWNV